MEKHIEQLDLGKKAYVTFQGDMRFLYKNVKKGAIKGRKAFQYSSEKRDIIRPWFVETVNGTWENSCHIVLKPLIKEKE